MSDAIAPSLFLDVRDLARELKVTTKTIAAWRARGLLPPPLKIGRLIRWRRADIAAMQLKH